jgi:anti-sigma factor RsiW
MTDEKDEPLSDLLRQWEPPVVPARLDDRVLAAFRREITRPVPSLWRRFLAAEVRIPLPLAAGLMLVLLLTGLFAMRRPSTAGTATAPAPAPVQAAHVAVPAVVTETSLSGFRPVDDVQITVMGERIR